MMTEAPKLRGYQERGVAAAAGAFSRRPSGSLLLVLPPAAGKTLIGARVLRTMVLEQGLRAVAVAHRSEIVDSIVEHLVADGVPMDAIGVAMADDNRRNDLAPIQVGSIQTFLRRRPPPADLVWLDEAHLDPGTRRSEFIGHYRQSRSFVLGTTATPRRLDGKGFEDLYDRMEVVVRPSELIANRWISVPEVWGVKDDLLPKLNRRARSGDFSERESDAATNQPRLIGEVVSHWLERSGRRTSLGYATSVRHSLAMVERFRKAGVKSEHIDGTMPKGERARILANLRSGKTKILWSNDLLTTGVNIPEARCVVVARPTLSDALHIQICGRAFRLYGDEGSTILDHAGNYTRLGDPLDDGWDWDLRGQSQGDGPAPMKTCQVCGAMCPAGCDACSSGHPFPRVDRASEDKEEELVRLAEEKRAEIEQQVRSAATAAGIHDEGWIAKVVALRLGKAA